MENNANTSDTFNQSMINKSLGIFLFFCSIFPSFLSAQEVKEIEVEFNSKCWLGGSARSKSYEVKPNRDADFTGVSAYTHATHTKPELAYRIQTNEDWSEWRNFQKNHHGETPGRTAFEGAPIQEYFSAIQFKSSDSLDEPIVFRLYFPQTGIPQPEKKSPDKRFSPTGESSCSCSQPSYCDRWCWCPDSSCTTGYTPTPTQPTHIIVHHSAGFNSSTNFKSVVAYYWDLHVNTNGWDDIGYNWLIDPNGEIYEARGSGATGAHFSCMNSNTTGICMIGNFENQNPTVLAKQSLKALLAWEACDKGISVGDSSLHASSQLMLNHISGHRDGNLASTGCPKGTLCPGAWLYNQLTSIITDVASEPCQQVVSSDEQAVPKISIYPNPVHQKIYLQNHKALSHLEILNTQAEVIYRFNSVEGALDVSSLASGMYFLQTHYQGATSRIRFIKH